MKITNKFIVFGLIVFILILINLGQMNLDRNSLMNEEIISSTSETSSIQNNAANKILDENELTNMLESASSAMKSTNLDKAKEILSNILESDPENMDAIYGMGELYSRYGDMEKATEYFHDYLNVSDNSGKNISNRASLTRLIEDPNLHSLRSSPSFHNLLRIHDTTIEEMETHITAKPIQRD
ncbi:MAG TPA: tetratricopeptide repeat protein [Oligoflexia bacterium]|nr:tetratricopeptide repeat protein [Oligoflexia bacterium]HMP48350.1 tetratricopeptide repeat protein [Oligoflexia bacterium]